MSEHTVKAFDIDLQERLPGRADELRVLIGGIGRSEARANREHEIGFADDRVGRRLTEVAAHP